MKYSMTQAGVPVGSYTATFTSVEEYTANAEQYGAGIKFTFTIVGGPHDGSEASRICSQKASAKSNLTKIVQGLNGGPLAAGEEIDLDKFIGQKYLVIVEETDSGATRVGTVLKS